MRNKIISLFLSIFMLIGTIIPSIEVVYAEGNNLPTNNESISTKTIDDYKTKQSGEKLEEDNIIKTSDELSENKEVNKEDNLLTENPETMRSAEKATEVKNLTEVYLDSKKGYDNNDGTKEKPLKTFAKAIEKAKDGDTLNVVSLTETNLIVNKKITLKFLEDVTMQGSGTAIELKDGAHLCVAEGKTLNINGYNKGILVEKGAEINDGNYVFKFPKSGFAFETSGNIVGTSKDKLKMDITNGYFMFHSKDNELRNATINQRYDDDKWQLYEWNGFKAFDSEINLYRLPVYLKGPLYLDNTKFVIDGTGVNYQTGAYFENSWEVGVFHFTNNSIFEVKNFNTHWRAKGITFGYDNKVLVDNGAKIVVKNNKNGGFNDNQGIATFNGGYLEGEGHSGSLFGAQDKANTKIVFGADSVVNTPMKSDSDNGLGQSGTNYIVIGGSHKVKYSPNYQGGLAIPVNGEENGNEKLTWFQLKDKSIEKLTPINKNGKTYDYSVKNPSDDGNKYVWTPAAKATFKLNNNDASFSDKTNDNKEFKTIRGYKLDDVVGNVNPGDPTDKNGVKFLGWYYKTDKGEEKSFDWNEKLTTDTEVYAKWQRKTVIYHNGAGKDYISSVGEDAKNIEVLSFDDILKEKDDFKVEGKKFAGWTTTPDGSGKVYKAKDKIDFTEGQSQIDLYAKYTDNEYKVSFSANGGTFSDNSIFKTNADVFTIEKDKNGGDVAVLIKKAKFNDKLFDLLNGLDHNKLKPDKDARRTGFVISNADYFSDSAEAGGKAIRFDDYKLLGFLDKKGENPQITADTTYYLTWKDDPNIPNENKISSQETIDSDIWSDSKQTSKDIKIISENKEFALTGEVNVSSIKDKMKAIEEIFNKEEKDFDKIYLTGTKSTFTATLTLPEEVEVPKNLQVEAKGLGDCFEVSETKVNGQKITVTFKLKDGMTDYKKLKKAVFSTGDNDNTLSVTVNGLKLKDFDKIKDGQKFTIKGEVKGEFSSVAKDGDTIKKFNFKWTGNQSKEGKDVEAKDDSTIQYTIMVSKPVQLTLGGDLLVKKANEDYDTEHDMVYPVNKGDLLTFDGKLDVSSIKNQIQSLKDDFDNNNNNSSNEITTKDIKSEFVASIEFPEGLEIPQNPTATLTENNLFKVERTEVNGNKIIVKMTLKKDYTKFIDLYTDVTSVNDKLDLEIPNIKVKDDVKSREQLTVIGNVNGIFKGVATSQSGKKESYNYLWIAEQTEDGKDFIIKDQNDNKTIQYTILVKNQVKPEPKPEPKHKHKYHDYHEKTVEPILNIDDHYAYMVGYPNRTFGADQQMTRAEVTMMFARLLKERPVGTPFTANRYSDVVESNWFSYAVDYMSEQNIIKGYPDGTFRPDAPITRAEFAAMSARFDELADVGNSTFSDVSADHWATKVIAQAANKGWVSGYPDGTFKPNQNITRAEVVSSTNRILNRYADLDFAKTHKDELAPMVDITETHWAYGAIVEAMNGHDYVRLADGKAEKWEKLNGKSFTFPTPLPGYTH